MKRNIWTYLALALIAFAGLGVLNKYFISGEHAFGVSPTVPWGALIAYYVFFAAAATGTGLVASLGHVFRVKRFEVLSKRALIASILLLTSAFGILAIELSNPFKMIWLLFTPNFSSPIFWMGAFYGVYLVLLFGELFFSIKDNHKAAVSIAYVSLFVKIAALINLGRVFGFSATREFWHGYYYPAYIIVSAIVSGAAVLTIMVYLISKKDSKLDYEGQPLVASLGKILAGAIIVLAAMQAFKLGTAITSGDIELAGPAQEVISGPIAPSFWIMEVLVGIVIPLIILFTSRFLSRGKILLAASLTITGLLFSRLGFVYSGLIFPLQIVPGKCSLIESLNMYSPTWSEWSLVLGAMGFIYIAFSFAENKLKLDVKH